MIIMIALMAITTIGISLLGYLMMVRLDRFIDSGGFVEGTDALLQHMVLIYAPNHDQVSLEKSLNQHHIRFQFILDPHIPENTIPVVVAALSESDMDNLLLCNEARHLHPELVTISLCNDKMYSRLFKESGITCVFYNDFSPNMLLRWLHNQDSFNHSSDYETATREEKL